MHLCAAQPAEPVKGSLCRFVLHCAHGKRREYLIDMQPRVFVSEITRFQRLNRLDDLARNQQRRVVDPR